MRREKFWSLLALLALAPTAARAQTLAEPPKQAAAEKPSDDAKAAAAADESRFIRISRDDDGDPLALQTAVVRYVPADHDGPQVVVDLIGAVHVGEKSYYDRLNELFTKYDVVLYELVAPEDTRPVPGKPSGSLVSKIQGGMKSMLKIEFQLDRVDYSQRNLVHADMSPDEFARTMKERGESVWTMLGRMMQQGEALQKAQGGDPNVSLLLALMSENPAVALKRVLAEQFENMDAMAEAFEGSKGSTIIAERNKVALAKLKERLDGDAGKPVKVGIFYGCAHFPDMEKRLLDDFELRRTTTRWLDAWDLQLR